MEGMDERVAQLEVKVDPFRSDVGELKEIITALRTEFRAELKDGLAAIRTELGGLIESLSGHMDRRFDLVERRFDAVDRRVFSFFNLLVMILRARPGGGRCRRS